MKSHRSLHLLTLWPRFLDMRASHMIMVSQGWWVLSMKEKSILIWHPVTVTMNQQSKVEALLCVLLWEGDWHFHYFLTSTVLITPPSMVLEKSKEADEDEEEVEDPSKGQLPRWVCLSSNNANHFWSNSESAWILFYSDLCIPVFLVLTTLADFRCSSIPNLRYSWPLNTCIIDYLNWRSKKPKPHS